MLRVRGLAALFVLPLSLPLGGVTAARAAVYDPALTRNSEFNFFELQKDEAPLPPLQVLVVEHVAQSDPVTLAAVEPGVVKRLFKALAGAVMPEEALADTPPTLDMTKGKGMIADEQDPNFKLWQSMADERLKAEQGIYVPKLHPLAAQHPDEFIVVCEAGCRKAPDDIVYSVMKSAAVARVTRLATTAAAGESGPAAAAQVPVAQAGNVQEPDTILCVAGCYEAPKVHEARKPRLADADHAEAPHHAVAEASEPPRARSPARKSVARAIPATEMKPSVRKILAHLGVAKRAATATRKLAAVSRTPRPQDWRTKIVFATPPKDAMHPSPASARVRDWHTKVIFASSTDSAVAENPQLAALVRLDRVKHYKQALQPLRAARIAYTRINETRY